MIEKVNKDLKQIKTFHQLKLLKFATLNKIIFKKTKVINELYKDLKRMANQQENAIDLDLYKEREIFNKTDIVNKNKTKIYNIKKKFKIIPKKA